MNDEDARTLHAAARSAHRNGDVTQALALFRTLLERHPAAEQAADAVYYLTSGHRRALSTEAAATEHD